MCTEEGSKARGKWGIPGGTPDDDGTVRQADSEANASGALRCFFFRETLELQWRMSTLWSEKLFAASVCMQSCFSMPNQVPAFCKQWRREIWLLCVSSFPPARTEKRISLVASLGDKFFHCHVGRSSSQYLSILFAPDLSALVVKREVFSHTAAKELHPSTGQPTTATAMLQSSYWPRALQ